VRSSWRIGSVVAVLALTTACSGPDIGPRITAPTSAPPPAGLIPEPTPGGATTTRSLGPAPADIRTVNWDEATLPGNFCDVDELVQFHAGEALAQSSSYGETHLTVEEMTDTVYGDLDGDGKEEAVVPIGCDNNGGTASGQLAFGAVAVQADEGELRSLGSITTKVNPDDALHVTLISGLRIRPGAVEVDESWYRPSDSTATPSGTATTTWTLTSGTLVAGLPAVTG